jgi:hypothetical protein
VIVFTRVAQRSLPREYHGPALLLYPNGVTGAVRLEFALQLGKRSPRGSQPSQCRAALILKRARKINIKVYVKEPQRWSVKKKKGTGTQGAHTLGSSNTLCGNSRVQFRQLFLACGSRFSGAIKAVLHLVY